MDASAATGEFGSANTEFSLPPDRYNTNGNHFHRVCFQFLRGKCTFPRCKYSHSLEEIRPPNNFGFRSGGSHAQANRESDAIAVPVAPAIAAGNPSNDARASGANASENARSFGPNPSAHGVAFGPGPGNDDAARAANPSGDGRSFAQNPSLFPTGYGEVRAANVSSTDGKTFALNSGLSDEGSTPDPRAGAASFGPNPSKNGGGFGPCPSTSGGNIDARARPVPAARPGENAGSMNNQPSETNSPSAGNPNSGDNGGNPNSRKRFLRGVCHQWLEKGFCRFGDRCRFPHIAQIPDKYFADEVFDSPTKKQRFESLHQLQIPKQEVMPWSLTEPPPQTELRTLEELRPPPPPPINADRYPSKISRIYGDWIDEIK